jgi:hypothetical protein
MHRPLLLLSCDRVEGCGGGAAGGVETAAVGGVATADGELAFLHSLGDLLLLPL